MSLTPPSLPVTDRPQVPKGLKACIITCRILSGLALLLLLVLLLLIVVFGSMYGSGTQSPEEAFKASSKIGIQLFLFWSTIIIGLNILLSIAKKKGHYKIAYLLCLTPFTPLLYWFCSLLIPQPTSVISGPESTPLKEQYEHPTLNFSR